MLTIHADTSSLYRRLAGLAQVQIPFGVATGINKTLKQIQAAQRAHNAQVFVLRRPSYVNNMVRIGDSDWATKQSLIGRVRMGSDPHADVGQGRQRGMDRFAGDLLRHEEGGTFAEGYWIPTEAIRPSFSALVPLSMWPTALGQVRTSRQLAANTAGEAKAQGKRRTFLLVNRQGQMVGIYQRYGLRIRDIRKRVRAGNAPSVEERHDEGIRMIWRYQAVIRLRRRLGWHGTASETARLGLGPNVEAGVINALRTARTVTQSAFDSASA